MSSPNTARAAALRILTGVATGRAMLSDLLVQDRGYSQLAPRDRAFAHHLVLTFLRQQGRINATINGLIPDPARLPEKARQILALGLVQILHLDTPAHAAVGETVALAPESLRGLINAVLRRATREKDALKSQTYPPGTNTERWLWQRWCQSYGPEHAARIEQAHTNIPPLDLTLLTENAALRTQLGGTRLPNGTQRLHSAGDVTELPGFAEGAWMVQDMAASLPVLLLGDVCGKHVLDLCAAPGGKTAQLLSRGAKVTAVDSSASRMLTLRENLARLRPTLQKIRPEVPQPELITADLLDWQPTEPADGILLDAPCSATGTLRRHPELGMRKSADNVMQMAGLQQRLLERIAQNAGAWLKPGGTLVYAVCSLEMEEGELQIRRFLGTQPQFRRAALTRDSLFGQMALINPEGDLRTLPCHAADPGGMDGFFAARLVYEAKSG